VKTLVVVIKKRWKTNELPSAAAVAAADATNKKKKKAEIVAIVSVCIKIHN
jgi:hypothetical protein